MSKKELIVFIDSGDTIVEEGTQIWEDGLVLSADLIEGADEMMRTLHEKGYRVALVADGRTQSFVNVYNQHDLNHVFEKWVISEEEGVEKPHQQMFEQALIRMGLTEEDKKRIVMVGNNVKRDVLGANDFGITSILIDYSPRYNMVPENDAETPDYTITWPLELLPLLEEIEASL